MESPMQETIYGTNSDDSHVMSEKVQSLAANIYQELERMMERYDEDVVKELMPLVVNVLESLDTAVMDNQEHEVELELLREDNEQLATQYERERQLRKAAEQKLIEIEYSTDDDRKNLSEKVESLESLVRMLELKSKNASDHAARLEEKDTETRKEYSTLHERYTDLFKTHMDYMERTKILFGSDKLEALNNKTRFLHFPHSKTDVASFISPQEPGAKILNSPLDMPTLISPNQSSDSNASLKSEIQEAAYASIATSPKRKSGSKKEKSVMEKGQLTDRVPLSDRSTGTRDGWVDDLDANLNDASIESPEMDEVEEIDGFSFNLENSKLQSERRRQNTLYQELSFQDNDALVEMDEGADISESDGESEREPKVNDNFFGMGKEVENLISENNELLATKNALNIVKDDLIAKVDELTSEQEILREELKQYMSVKERLKQRISELEEELKKVKESGENQKSGKSDDEEELPMAQRKRFTRVEMARVLMERNQYKERLMELQEAVRWTEMIRASRSDSSLDTKRNKSSIWKFFSNLFNPNEKPTRKSTPFVNVHYNAPTSNSGPALDTMRKKRLGDRHRGLDILDSDLVSEKLQQQRAKERKEQYKQVRAHVRKEDGRLQAYGWSLPSKTGSVSKNSEADGGGQIKPNASTVPVPVPVFCRPLLEKELGMKVWCAAGVDLTGGKPESDFSNVSSVGSSLFYVSSPESSDAVSKLSDEIKDYEKHHKEQSEMDQKLSSFVWICTSTHTTSKVSVVDANNPAEILDSFHVCNSHLLCIASVPGIKSTDYPADDEFLKLGKRECISDVNDAQAGKVGDLLYVSVSEPNSDSAASTPVNNDNVQCSIADEIRKIEEDSNRAQNAVNKEQLQQAFSDPLQNNIGTSDPLSQDPNEREKMSTVLPTMWLGSQTGHIYVHSSVTQWWRCISSVKLRDSVLSIVHIRGRVFAGLADGTIAIFHRCADGEWDLENFHLLDLGRPLYSVRCMTIVDKNIWCGYRNCVHVIDSETLAIIESFDAHPRKESQVRQMAWIGDGVWITIRLDSTLRLYHAHTRQHLQDVDIEPYVSKMLGTGKLGFSFVRITSLLVSCKRLWMGTGNGVIISVPLAEGIAQKPAVETSGRAPGGVVRVYSESGDTTKGFGFIPYCSMAQAQLSFHGHRDAVKFFVAVPGLIISCQNAAFAISRFLAGVLSDRTNPRLLFTAGLLLSGITTLLFSSSSSVGVYCTLWFLNGLAQGCGWPSCVKFMRQRASPSELGTLWSLLSSGNNLSGCLSPLLSAFLVTNYGWRTSVGVAGATSIALGCLSLVSLQDATRSSPQRSNPKKESQRRMPGSKDGDETFIDLLRNPLLGLTSAGFLVVLCAKSTLVDWGQLFLIEERRFTQQNGSAFTSSLEFGGLFGRIVAGFLTDNLIRRLGKKSDPMRRSKTRMSVAMAFMLMSVVALYALHSTVYESSSMVWVLLLGFLLGFCVNGPITIFGIVSTESAPPHLSGSSNAIASLAGNVGAMISGFPFCSVAKLSGWWAVFVILEVATTAVLGVMMIGWKIHSKPPRKVKKQ